MNALNSVTNTAFTIQTHPDATPQTLVISSPKISCLNYVQGYLSRK